MWCSICCAAVCDALRSALQRTTAHPHVDTHTQTIYHTVVQRFPLSTRKGCVVVCCRVLQCAAAIFSFRDRRRSVCGCVCVCVCEFVEVCVGEVGVGGLQAAKTSTCPHTKNTHTHKYIHTHTFTPSRTQSATHHSGVATRMVCCKGCVTVCGVRCSAWGVLQRVVMQCSCDML